METPIFDESIRLYRYTTHVWIWKSELSILVYYYTTLLSKQTSCNYVKSESILFIIHEKDRQDDG